MVHAMKIKGKLIRKKKKGKMREIRCGIHRCEWLAIIQNVLKKRKKENEVKLSEFE